MIDINKKYKTASGLEVQLFTTNCPIMYEEVIGVVKQGESDWRVTTWGKHGSSAYHNSELQLIEISAESYSPFSFEDGKDYIGEAVVCRNGSIQLITGIWDKEEPADSSGTYKGLGVRFGVGTNGNIYDSSQLLASFTFLNGHPCGVKQE